jgi:hypothetical protein
MAVIFQNGERQCCGEEKVFVLASTPRGVMGPLEDRELISNLLRILAIWYSKIDTRVTYSNYNGAQ